MKQSNGVSPSRVEKEPWKDKVEGKGARLE
jgi:hypothetical protein